MKKFSKKFWIFTFQAITVLFIIIVAYGTRGNLQGGEWVKPFGIIGLVFGGLSVFSLLLAFTLLPLEKVRSDRLMNQWLVFTFLTVFTFLILFLVGKAPLGQFTNVPFGFKTQSFFYLSLIALLFVGRGFIGMWKAYPFKS